MNFGCYPHSTEQEMLRHGGLQLHMQELRQLMQEEQFQQLLERDRDHGGQWRTNMNEKQRARERMQYFQIQGDKDV